MRSNLGFRPIFAVIFSVAFLFPAASVQSQSELENTLKQYSADAVQGYIQPIADFFGANMNAGFYHSAAVPVAGLHFEVDVIVMGSVVGDDKKTYTAKAPTGFNPGTFKTATIFGGKGGTVTDQSTGFQYKGSDGIINASLFPLAVPQLTVGSFYGTDVVIRFIGTPSIDNDKFPKTTLFGIGARHSISQYIPLVPLDIAAGVFYTSFTVGDIIDFKGIALGAQASKSFQILTIYGGLQWEKSTMNLKYTSSDPNAPPAVDIDLDGDNSFRFTVGSSLSVVFFKLFADANFGSVTNFSGGIGVGF